MAKVPGIGLLTRTPEDVRHIRPDPATSNVTDAASHRWAACMGGGAPRRQHT
jgi:hypothetical protein